MLLVIFVFVFNTLWRAIAGGDGELRGLTVVQLTWYLVFTEMVELARPSIMAEIQEQVQDGSIAYGLVRPYSYPLFALARALGQALTKTMPIGMAGAAVALALVGPLPGLAAALPRGVTLMAGALLLNCLWMLIIGITAFWFESVLLRGRDAGYPAPPAQIRTCALTHTAPTSGSDRGPLDRRIRSAAWYTELRHCVRSVLRPREFPLVTGLGSASSAAARTALFPGFSATMPVSDFFGPFIIGLRPRAFPMRSQP